MPCLWSPIVCGLLTAARQFSVIREDYVAVTTESAPSLPPAAIPTRWMTKAGADFDAIDLAIGPGNIPATDECRRNETSIGGSKPRGTALVMAIRAVERRVAVELRDVHLATPAGIQRQWSYYVQNNAIRRETFSGKWLIRVGQGPFQFAAEQEPKPHTQIDRSRNGQDYLLVAARRSRSFGPAREPSSSAQRIGVEQRTVEHDDARLSQVADAR